MTFTKEGIRYIIALLLIALAAFNTGNNLIFLILALMLSAGVTSVIFLWMNMNGIILSVDLTGPFYAGSNGYLRINARNSKKKLPSYSVIVKTPFDSVVSGALVAFVEAGGNAEISSSAEFSKRGRFPIDGLAAVSSFPFGLIERKIHVSLPGYLTVYPRIIDFGDSVFRSSSGPSGSRTVHGRGDEFHMIRGYLTGDDIRRVSWKATAKTGDLMVREYGREIGGLITVTLDDTGTAVSGDFEMAVSFAASAVKMYIDRGFMVRFVTSGNTIPFGSGTAHLYKILDHLATVDEVHGGHRASDDEDRGGILVLKGEGSVLEAQRDDYESIVYADSL